MLERILFIYAKDGKLTSVEFNENCESRNDELKKDGCLHTSTIDPVSFLANLIKLSDVEIVGEIARLRTEHN